MRSRFDNQLETLNTELIQMGALVENAIASAVEALIKCDEASARRAVDYDRQVDQKEKEIESLCLKLLLQQHPVARDLRQISAALKMITDMERIGDQASDISEISLLLMEYEPIPAQADIAVMASAAISMVNHCIDSFVKKELSLAHEVMAYDDVVDDLFDKIRHRLIDYIREHGEAGEQAMDYMMIAKYLERIGDHAVNIAEWVEFSITGSHRREENEED